MFNKLLDKTLKCGVTNGSRYNLSAEIPEYRTPSGQQAHLTLKGYIVFRENYYTSKPPEPGDGGMYPYVASDIDRWEWTWVSPVPLADFGNQDRFHQAGSNGTIEFHNDPNDASRPGDGFLPAWTFDLPGSSIHSHVNDLAGGTPGYYDMGINGAFPNYEMTETIRFDVDSSNFFGGPQTITHDVTFTRAPERFCPLAPLWRWLYKL